MTIFDKTIILPGLSHGPAPTGSHPARFTCSSFEAFKACSGSSHPEGENSSSFSNHLRALPKVQGQQKTNPQT